jgi:rubrerythrin
MIIHTASEGITLARKLENDSAKFYEDMAGKYSKDAATLQSFAQENKKNIAQVERAYYGVITDAIEGGYAFNLDTDKYNLKTELAADAAYADSLKQALAIEEMITAFYNEAAKQSGGLMADVPRTFLLVAKKRTGRIEKLKQLA